jgi:DNA-binding transcriptional regulator YhcF (GntR family)
MKGPRKVNPIRQAVENTIRAMVQQGSSIRKIAAALNISPNTVQRVRNDMKALQGTEDLKSGLLSPQRDQNTGKLIDHFIDKGLKMKKIKGSDALGAVKMYADRRWPVRSEAPPPARTFIQTNLNIFLPDSQPAAVDVTPTTTRGVLEDGKETREKNLNQFNTCNVRL